MSAREIRYTILIVAIALLFAWRLPESAAATAKPVTEIIILPPGSLKSDATEVAG